MKWQDESEVSIGFKLEQVQSHLKFETPMSSIRRREGDREKETVFNFNFIAISILPISLYGPVYHQASKLLDLYLGLDQLTLEST